MRRDVTFPSPLLCKKDEGGEAGGVADGGGEVDIVAVCMWGGRERERERERERKKEKRAQESAK